jgi:hypothetical protein
MSATLTARVRNALSIESFLDAAGGGVTRVQKRSFRVTATTDQLRHRKLANGGTVLAPLDRSISQLLAFEW